MPGVIAPLPFRGQRQSRERGAVTGQGVDVVAVNADGFEIGHNLHCLGFIWNHEIESAQHVASFVPGTTHETSRATV